MSEAESRQLLDALRSPDPRVSQAAVESLLDKLEKVARGTLRGKEQRAGFQPESIVQSVVANHLDRVREAASNDQELEAWLKREIRRKAIDRARHANVRDRHHGQVEQDDVAPSIGPGPSSIARHHEENSRDAVAHARLEQWLVSLLEDTASRQLVTEYLIQGVDVATVAANHARSEGAIRTQMSRLRPQLVEQLVNSVRDELDASTWAAARAVFCSGLSPVAAAELLGVRADDVGVMLGRFVPLIRERFGANGLLLLESCRKGGSGKPRGGTP